MKTNDEMFVILNSNKTFNTIGYKKAVAAKHERMSKFAKTFSKTGNTGAVRIVSLSDEDLIKIK